MTPPSRQWALRVEDGPTAGTMVTLSGSSLTIGSAPVTDLQLPASSGVARVHAEITRHADGFSLRGTSDDARVMVNGESIRTHELRLDDVVQIGKRTMRLVEVGASAAPSGGSSRTPAGDGSETASPESRPSPLASLGLQRIPLWLQLYLVGILVAACYLGYSRFTERPVSLPAIQAQEVAHATARQRDEFETGQVLRLLQTAVAHEGRGDVTSAFELYRAVIVARQPPDPNAPASRFAARRMAALQLAQ